MEQLIRMLEDQGRDIRDLRDQQRKVEVEIMGELGNPEKPSIRSELASIKAALQRSAARPRSRSHRARQTGIIGAAVAAGAFVGGLVRSLINGGGGSGG